VTTEKLFFATRIVGKLLCLTNDAKAYYKTDRLFYELKNRMTSILNRFNVCKQSTFRVYSWISTQEPVFELLFLMPQLSGKHLHMSSGAEMWQSLHFIVCQWTPS
jgi:hypothetical protein